MLARLQDRRGGGRYVRKYCEPVCKKLEERGPIAVEPTKAITKAGRYSTESSVTRPLDVGVRLQNEREMKILSKETMQRVLIQAGEENYDERFLLEFAANIIEHLR